MKIALIAPCGMNCALCMAYHRDERHCGGCRMEDNSQPFHCRQCSIIFCEHLRESKSKYCFGCEIFPCKRLKNLDKRYRTKYGMSMIENLNKIKEAGIRKFVKDESIRWQCKNCGAVLCAHRDKCPSCGKKWEKRKY